MEAAENTRFIYEFGKFVLDPKEKTWLSDGVLQHVPAKEFETLVLLMEHNGHALRRRDDVRHLAGRVCRSSQADTTEIQKRYKRNRTNHKISDKLVVM